MPEEDDIVGDIFGWVGTAIATFFYIAPVVPFLKLIKGEISWKESPGVLLICSFMNCILWSDYGLLQDKFLVYFANGLGGTITLIFITIFLIHLADKKFCFAFLYTLCLIAVIVGLAFLCYEVIKSDITGKIAMVFNVLMYAAPGEKIITVFRTGDVSLIPIWSTIGGTACSSCWLIYGIYQNDLNLIIPNLLGVLASIVQIVVYLIFRGKSINKNENQEQENNDNEE